MLFTERTLKKIENLPTNFKSWSLTFLALIALRVLVENWVFNFSEKSFSFIFYNFTHIFLFFLFSYILFFLLIKKMINGSFKSTSNLLLIGFFIMLTPPIIDWYLSGGNGFWSFYELDGMKGLLKRYLTFFGDNPRLGITYGVRIEVAISIIFLSLLTYIKTKKIKKTLLSAWLSYSLFFILGTFPSWITLFTNLFNNILSISNLDIAAMFLTPFSVFSQDFNALISILNIKMSIIYALIIPFLLGISLYVNFPKKTLAFIKNIRPAQIIFHLGIFFIGIFLSFIFESPVWKFNFFNILSTLLIINSIIFAWLSSVIYNDIADKKIDTLTNPKRPLILKTFTNSEYKTIGLIFTIAALLSSAIINFKITLLIIFYLALTWIYSSWPLRLKRIPFIATLTSSIAAIMILFIGYIISSPQQSISNLPTSIILLLIISYTISLPLKDFKDIKGDKKDNVYTLPVLFGTYWSKIIIGSGIFTSFILSVIIFNEFSLIWWAILFGGIAFWIINYSQEKGFINYRNITWWILGVVFIYIIALVKIIF